MTLMIRMARLFNADFHRVLDHIEEPEALLRHAIREMQDNLDKAVIDLDSSQQRNRGLTDRIGELDQSLDEIDTQLDLCFESKKDELARGPVKRKLEANALKKRLAAQQSLTRQSIQQQQDTLAENQVRLEHLRQKADSLRTRHDHNRDEQGSLDSLLAGVGGIAIDDTDVDVAILREKKLRSAP